MLRITAVCLLACGSSSLIAQSVVGDTTVTRQLAPGVAYRQFVDKSGPFVVNLVRVDLRRTDLELRHVRARDQLKGRETVADMARRLATGSANVLAAINADFFNLQSGENENNQVIGGEWWKGLKNTDSPYDTYDNAHVQFGLDARRRPVMDRFLFDGRAWSHGTATPIITLNFDKPGAPEGVVLYTSRFGASTPRDTTRQTAEAAMSAAGRRGDTLLFVRRGAVSSSSGSAIPSDGVVIAAYGAGRRLEEVRAMADGDTVKILLATIPRTSRSLTLLIGGWPRILRDGVNVANEAPVVEGTISRNAEARHPRRRCA